MSELSLFRLELKGDWDEEEQVLTWCNRPALTNWVNSFRSLSNRPSDRLPVDL